MSVLYFSLFQLEQSGKKISWRNCTCTYTIYDITTLSQLQDSETWLQYQQKKNSRWLFSVALWNLHTVMLLTFSSLQLSCYKLHHLPVVCCFTKETATTTLVFAVLVLGEELPVIHYKFIVIHLLASITSSFSQCVPTQLVVTWCERTT